MTRDRQPVRAHAVELRHLRYFVATAEELHFGRAAERLRIAQPGLSQQIRTLEALVGTALFHRTRRSVELTLAGELFLAEARKTLEQAERTVLVAQQAGRGERGRIEIGYVASAAYTGVLTSLFSAFRKTHPQVDLRFMEMEMSRQLDTMHDGKLDIAFIRPPVELPAGVAAVTILREPVILAISCEHPLARHDRIPLAELSRDSFITPHHAPGVSFHEHTVAACGRVGFVPRIAHQGRDFTTIASMVAVGLGVALVPRSLRCIQLPGVLYRPIADTEVWANLAVAFRRTERSAATQALIRQARDFVMPTEPDAAP